MDTIIIVYSFEDQDGQDITSWTTQDNREAWAFAREHQCVMIRHEYTWTDSEEAASFLPSDTESEDD